jgi:hypothetical protein
MSEVMGSVGEYWRDHKDYSGDRKAADGMGVSLGQYRRTMRKMEQEEALEKKAAILAKHSIQCECGRTFLDVNAHNSHKMHTGRKGHKGAEITAMESAHKESL